jgi:hypothetical protein
MSELSQGGLLASRPAFDRFFIFGTLALALGLGAVASISAAALTAVVLLDIWLFANPHVVATYTRISACAADVRRHWFLIFVLPAVVLASVLIIALACEVAGLFTLYFIAQTYHVCRQSFGIARNYKRMDSRPFQPDRLAELLIYLFPVWGLLARCAGTPRDFLGYSIALPNVSPLVADAAGAAAIACSLWWIQRRGRVALAGDFNWRHEGFVASHVCVFLVAYIWIGDLTLGWLVVNIWHNLQYLLFVWAQNIRRDRLAHRGAAVDLSAVTTEMDLTGLCGRAARYGGLCLLLGAALYQALNWAGTQLLWLGLPTMFIAHFTFTFHHYMVDGVIWKRRRLRGRSGSD